jgi:hypothetical protein
VSPAHCHISLAPDFANLSALESFVESCSFLEKEERLRILLIATEYFQNIVAYNRNPVRSAVDLRIVKDAAVPSSSGTRPKFLRASARGGCDVSAL